MDAVLYGHMHPHDRIRGYTSRVFYIEVKSSVSSLGEILRELQWYHNTLGEDVKKNHVVLVSPPTRFAGLIREQGFSVIEYPKGTVG